MSLTAAAERVAFHLRNLNGMRHAPDDPPESVNVFPFGVAYLGSGSWDNGFSSTGKPILNNGPAHNITYQIHVARRDLAKDVDLVKGYVELLRTQLQTDPTLNDNVITIVSMDYDLGPLEWNGVDTIGYSGNITVRTAEDC